MTTIKGHEFSKKGKQEIIYSRMDDDMISQLKNIRKITGMPISEIVRESVRRVLLEVQETGSLKIKIRND